tara:strand:+ start:245 stop:595 length:351 start_codon:yes stop_codon:yes gene_type:complete
MNKNKLDNINELIKNKKIDQAQTELSKLSPEFLKDAEYLYLRGKIFYLNKLYYIALDTLLISLEFKESDKTYNLIAKIYNLLGNKELSKKISNLNFRSNAINSLKEQLSGIYRKEL